MSTWVKVPRLGTFLWFQYLNFPPCASHQTSYISCIHWVSKSILPPSLSATSCIHLIQYLNFTPGAPQQFPAFMWLHMWHPPGLSRNFLQASCFNILQLSHTCASQQLPAFMQFQYPGFSPSSLHSFLHASSFGFNIFALIWFGSILPPGPRPLPLHKLLAFILFQYLSFLPGAPQQLPAFILFQYLNFLPGAPQQLPEFISFQIWFLRCLSTFSCMHLVSISRLRPLVSPQILACFVIWVWCLIGFTPHLSTAYCAHLFLISNFLFPQCASQLPASIWFHMYVPPGGLSTTSCVYVVSISEFLLHPCASQQLPAWIWFNISASLVSQRLLALIWFQYLTNFPPCASHQTS